MPEHGLEGLVTEQMLFKQPIVGNCGEIGFSTSQKDTA